MVHFSYYAVPAMSNPFPTIVIMSRAEAGHYLMSTRPEKGRSLTYIVSIGEPGSKVPAGFIGHPARRLRLEFDDVEMNPEAAQARFGYLPPQPEHIERLLRFLAAAGPEDKVLFHCQAGISRSTAASYIFMCSYLGPGQEPEALRITDYASTRGIWPNSLMVKIADRMLERNGAMVDTLERWPT